MLQQWFHEPKAPLAKGENHACYGRESGDKLIWDNPFNEMRAALHPA